LGSSSCRLFLHFGHRRGVGKAQGSWIDMQAALDELDDFQAKWGLDDRCIDYLRKLPSEVQQRVVIEFDHRPDQTNPSARCMGFVKRIAQDLGVAPLAHGAGQGTSADPIGEFCARWGLDDRCSQLLASLPSEVFRNVTENFDHQPHQTNPSARCMAFARSLLQAHQSMDPLSAFQAKWGIDDRCTELLSVAPPELRTIVIEKFEHRPDQTNVSARCTAFLISIAKKHGIQLPLTQSMYNQQQHQQQEEMRQWKDPSIDEGGDDLERLMLFQAKWGIDDRCASSLAELPLDVLAVVLRDFEHRPGQTNVSARCNAFAHSVLRSHQSGNGITAPAQVAPSVRPSAFAPQGLRPRLSTASNTDSTAMALRPHAGRPQHPAASAGGEITEDVQSFQRHWGIDDQCAEFLMSLPPTVQAIVFEKFSHEAHQTNPSARCKAFARGILQTHQQQASEDPLVAFQHRWGIDDSCLQFLRTLPPEAQSTVITDFDHQPHQTNVSARCQAFAKSVMQKQPNHHHHHTANPRASGPPAVYSSGILTGGGSLKRTRAEFEVQSGHSIDHGHGQLAALRGFQAKWGLDEKCISHLQSLPPHAQAIVMENFQHRPDQTNVSARCMAFAKSVANTQSQQFQAFQAFQAFDPLTDFQAKWGLDSVCMKMLEGLPSEVQNAVISGFDHQPHQTNPSARCMAFAKSVAKGIGQVNSGGLDSWTGWG